MRLKKLVLYIVIVSCITLMIISSYLYFYHKGPANPREYLKIPLSPIVVSREGHILWVGLNQNGQWCLPVELSKVHPNVIKATLAVEDHRFWKHHGVDGRAVCRAVYQNLKHRRIVSGASTITMQLIKLYYKENPEHLHTWSRKGILFKFFQMVQATRLEKHATKQEILQAYLNKVSYGGNLLGIESASWKYFGKTSAELTIPECALLVGIPKSPEKYKPSSSWDSPSKVQRYTYVLKRMTDTGIITQDEYKSLSTKYPEVGNFSFPIYAFHWAHYITNQSETTSRIESTISFDIQKCVEEIVNEKTKKWAPHITNTAVLVVDVSTSEVVARVGGVMLKERVPLSYLDFCTVPRLPGSTLKPFLFGLALETGWLFPDEILLDNIYDTGNYNPKNFDEIFHGFVTASDALRFSLNIPAVMLLNRVGIEPFIQKLKQCGIDLRKHNKYSLGLSLILGGGASTLEEITHAYLCLANGGIYKKLKIIKNDIDISENQVFTKGTTIILNKMLSGKLTDEFEPEHPRISRTPDLVCWKTGTSSARMDAWAFLYDSSYLIGVWMGNPDGQGHVKLIGALTSLEIASCIFRLLPKKDYSPSLFKFEEEFKEIEVCRLSGLPANPNCPTTKKTYLPAKTPLARVCDVHYYDPKLNMVNQRFPAQAMDWDLAKIKQISVELKAKNKECKTLKIINPVHNAQYVWNKHNPNNYIRFQSSRDTSDTIFWFVNDIFVGKTNKETALQWEMIPGHHKIHCVDSHQNSDTIFIEIVPATELEILVEN